MQWCWCRTEAYASGRTSLPVRWEQSLYLHFLLRNISSSLREPEVKGPTQNLVTWYPFSRTSEAESKSNVFTCLAEKKQRHAVSTVTSSYWTIRTKPVPWNINHLNAPVKRQKCKKWAHCAGCCFNVLWVTEAHLVALALCLSLPHSQHPALLAAAAVG